MPFFLIPSTLAICFCLIWVFIGGMIFRDGQLAARHEREFDASVLPLAVRRVPGAPHMRRPKAKRIGGKRAAGAVS